MGIAGGQRNRSVGFLLMESWAGPGRTAEFALFCDA